MSLGVKLTSPEPVAAKVESKGDPEVSTYDFNGMTLRVVQIDGEPWFVAAYVLKAVGITTYGTVFRHIGADEKTKRDRNTLGMGHGSPINLLSESGLYKLITQSDKAEAKPFQEWVTRDVLPSIRKTGSYGAKAMAFCMASEAACNLASSPP